MKKDAMSFIEEDLFINVGVGATRRSGSDSYPYYVSEVLPNGVIGLYHPDSRFATDWTFGHRIVDPFDASKKSELYIRRAYGHWWLCSSTGKRKCRWHDLAFGHATSYRNPSF